MKLIFNLVTAIVLLSFSCGQKPDEDSAIINGNLANGKTGKIYLKEISKNDVIKDSTDIVDGKFTFKFKTDSSFRPHQVSLSMWDTYHGLRYLRPIGIINPYVANNIESVFYLDKGVTTISFKSKEKERYFYAIIGSPQNEPLYKHVGINWLTNDQRGEVRARLLDEDVKKIKSYPYSYHLLSLIYQIREQYTKAEVKAMIDNFDTEAKGSPEFNKIQSWLAYKNIDHTDPMPDHLLEDDKGVKQSIFDVNAKLNLLVFWASWCGPCRREIPMLKDIYSKYHHKGLAITSISVDNDQIKWHDALLTEKEPWRQLVINDTAKPLFDIEYNIPAIPVVVLLDRNHFVIKNFKGLLSEADLSELLMKLNEM